MGRFWVALLAAAVPIAPAAAQVAHPALWPSVAHRLPANAKLEARITALMARMNLEDKVGQLIQPDIGSMTPEDLRTFKVGSILAGGNSAPGNDDFAPAPEWLKYADRVWDAAMARSDGRPAIPVIWGIDAVHGHNNIVGATLFPHNIGLGAARDPELLREIGAVTAAETQVTGIDWSFAPTLAVVQDDRWGRTYESFSEEPSVVASYAGPMIEGLQGMPGTPGFMGPDKVIATPKHFLGDGGTGGHDQGDTRVPEAVLRNVHGAGYPPAIAAGGQTVMASFSSWNGAKMHGNTSLLTGVLKGRFGFDGLIVSDWNAHAQLPGCTVEHCPAAVNAGVDMFMISGDWKALIRNTVADVRSGAISQSRLDDAVRRILRVKLRYGAMERGRPSSRPLAGHYELLGSAAHRAVARRAVRESLVLLKNENHLLPLKPGGRILVAGPGADSISQQSGGWTISWQGTGLANDRFPHAESIWAGIRDAVAAAGGKPILSADGSFTEKPDAAIVVLGEMPYAEFAGDRPTLDYSPGDRSDLTLLKRLHAAHVPVVAVFLSGRPLWVNAELNASDAFVAAFLPGSEGGGVADVLLRRADGTVAHDFHGKLSFSWPKRPDQYVLNRRDAPYDPLFPFGYGLTYASAMHVGELDETRPAGLAVEAGPWFGRGRLATGWSVQTDAAVTVAKVDRRAQEDSRRFAWSGAASASAALIPATPLDLTKEANGELSLVIDMRVDRAPDKPVALAVAGQASSADVPIAGLLRDAGADWTMVAIPLRCFTAAGLRTVTVPLRITTAGTLTISVSDIHVASVGNASAPCGKP